MSATKATGTKESDRIAEKKPEVEENNSLKRPRTTVLQELETALANIQPASFAIGSITEKVTDVTGDIDAIIRCFEILLEIVLKLVKVGEESNESQAPLEARVNCQTAVLDLIEFLTVFEDSICVTDRSKLQIIRPLMTQTTTCFAELTTKVMVDTRVILPFTENRYGPRSKSKMASNAVLSDFNRIRGKTFRAVEMDWSERQSIISKLLKNVDERRRPLMMLGSDPSRGYNDMTDEELKGWSVFHNEVYLDNGNKAGAE